ncbi:MAG: hypothetical protein AAF800_06575 [Planctomycetota bacterium]
MMRVIVLLLVALLAGPAAAEPPPEMPASEPTPTIALADVKVGMRGYGKTVFHGQAIEPFAFEVVSVVSDSSAKRGTVWVVCTDERMTRSGPVQGMSGSPMYVWDEGEPHVLGEGGRLMGAFAFGYPDVNVCLVGVQPIEYMREVGDRARKEDLTQARRRGVAPGSLDRTLAALARTADRSAAIPALRGQLDAVTRLTRGWSAGTRLNETDRRPTAAPPARPEASSAPASVRPMLLPMAVGDAAAASWLAPLLEPAGIAVMADDLVRVAGEPPSHVDPATVRLEPGSVLSIPLAFGDLDLAAAGTATDVLPDGTVLGFGHAMQAVGSARLPMATGYTHFVVSRDSLSFKLAGSLDIVGGILRDEAAAVAGLPRKSEADDPAFFAAPVRVTAAYPGQPARDYDYRVVDHPVLTAPIVGAVVNASLTAVQAPPMFHTLRTTGTLTFTGGRTVTLDSVLPGGGMQGLAFDLLPPIAAMMQNPFDPLRLESAELEVTVETDLDLLTLTRATLDRAAARPGETVNVAVTLQPFDAPPRTRSLAFTLPGDLPPGEYQLLVSDAMQYTFRMLGTRPDLSAIDDIDALRDALQELAAVDREAVYLGLPLMEPGLAVAGRALDGLPRSHAAVLAATASSATTPVPRFVEQDHPTDGVTQGELTLRLVVLPNEP